MIAPIRIVPPTRALSGWVTDIESPSCPAVSNAYASYSAVARGQPDQALPDVGAIREGGLSMPKRLDQRLRGSQWS
jgi:hypothetical protein